MKNGLVKSHLFKLVLTAVLAIGTMSVPKTTNAQSSMGCYGWFDYVYKATGDLNFAYWHFQSCQMRSQQLVTKAPDLTFDGGITPVLVPDNSNFQPLIP